MGWRENWPEWQRKEGDRFGPGSQNQGAPVILVKSPYNPPGGGGTGDIPIYEAGFSIVNAATDYYQVIPPGNYDTIWIGASDADSLSYVRLHLGTIAGSGGGSLPGGFNAYPFDSFHQYSTRNTLWLRAEVPYGNVPFWVECRKPSGAAAGTNPTNLRLTLLSTGRRAVPYCGDCPPGSIDAWPPYTNGRFYDTFNRATGNEAGPVDTGQNWTAIPSGAGVTLGANGYSIVGFGGSCQGYYQTGASSGQVTLRTPVLPANVGTGRVGTFGVLFRYRTLGDEWRFLPGAATTNAPAAPGCYNLVNFQSFGATRTYYAYLNGTAVQSQPGDVIRVRTFRSSIECYVNGNLVIRVADGYLNDATGIRWGFSSLNNNLAYSVDDVEILW